MNCSLELARHVIRQLCSYGMHKPCAHLIAQYVAPIYSLRQIDSSFGFTLWKVDWEQGMISHRYYSEAKEGKDGYETSHNLLRSSETNAFCLNEEPTYTVRVRDCTWKLIPPFQYESKNRLLLSDTVLSHREKYVFMFTCNALAELSRFQIPESHTAKNSTNLAKNGDLFFNKKIREMLPVPGTNDLVLIESLPQRKSNLIYICGDSFSVQFQHIFDENWIPFACGVSGIYLARFEVNPMNPGDQMLEIRFASYNDLNHQIRCACVDSTIQYMKFPRYRRKKHHHFVFIGRECKGDLHVHVSLYNGVTREPEEQWWCHFILNQSFFSNV